MKRVYLLFFIFVLSLAVFENVSALTPISSCGATLNMPGETYYLTQNITSTGDICFNVDADDVTLDLNGYAINYANFTLDQAYNYDFEIAGANAQLADGWDFSQAPNTVRFAGDYYSSQVRSGSYGLQITLSPGSSDTIVSTDTVTLEPEFTYLPTGLWYSQGGVNLGQIYLDVIRASDDQVIVSVDGTRGGLFQTQRGMQFIPQGSQIEPGIGLFSVSTPTEVYFRLRVNGLTNANYYFDYVRFLAYQRRGIVTDLSQRFHILNGSLTQVNNKECLYCHSINGHLPGAVVENMTFRVGGTESKAINTGGSSLNTGGMTNGILRNNLIYHYAYDRDDAADLVIYRDFMYGVVDFEVNKGNLSIYNNRFLGSPQINIYIGTIPEGDRTTPLNKIYNNYFEGDTTYTNAFAIETRFLTNTMIYNNIFNFPRSGKGIHVDTSQSYNISVFDNWFNTTELPVQGPGGGMGYCLQVEGGTSMSDVFVYNNYCESHTNSLGGNALGLRISHELINSDIYNNTFLAFNDNPELGNEVYAYAFSAFGGNSINTGIHDNVFGSNHEIFNFAGAASDFWLVSNTARRLGSDSFFLPVHVEGASNPRVPSDNNTLLDTTLEGNIDLRDYQTRLDAEYVVSWFLDVEAYGAGFSPASGASVLVRDGSGSLVTLGTVDSSGAVRFVLEEFTVLGFNIADSTLTEVPQPYSITVTYGPDSDTQTVTMDSSQTLQFFFGGKSPDVNSDGNINVVDLAIVLFNQGRNAADAHYNHLDLDEDGDIDFSDAQIVVQYM